MKENKNNKQNIFQPFFYLFVVQFTESFQEYFK